MERREHKILNSGIYVVLMLCLTATVLTAMELRWHGVSCGGMINGSSSSYNLSSTVSQTAIGNGVTSGYKLFHGFWHEEASGSCCLTPGSANGDGSMNVGDAVFVVNYIFKGGIAPECPAEADCNEDCYVNVADAVYMVNYIFKGGPAPACGCAD